MHSNLDWVESAEWVHRLTPSTSSNLTKVRQLYLALYEAITNGALANGQQLPASRELARLLGIGRNTVIAVYNQLKDEGLIATGGRRGTTVTHVLLPERAGIKSGEGWANASLSRRSETPLRGRSGFVPLAPGMPDPNLFPKAAWRQALVKAGHLSADHLGYARRPLASLQQALCRYLAMYRSLLVNPEQLIITSGTRQSLMLAASLYTDPGDIATVESPGYGGAVDAFRLQGLSLRPLLVDGKGALIDGHEKSDTLRLIYLTPCFQYPTGAALSAQRRRAVLTLASQTGAVIFEDDYDSEFRDQSEARPALASSKRVGSETVLHAGTFSKLIFPAARIAWIVVPEAHVDVAQRCLRSLGGAHNTVAQATVAEIINNGSLAKHLQRARHGYSQRCEALVCALENTGQFYSLGDTEGSLSLVAKLKEPLRRQTLDITLNQAGLGVQFLEDLEWHKAYSSEVTALVLGLGNVSTLEIPAVVSRLAEAIERARKSE